MDFKALSDPVVLLGNEEKKPGFLNKIRPPKTKLTKQFLAGTLTVFLLFAVGVGVYLSQEPTELTPSANEKKIPSNLKTATPSASLYPR